MDVIGSSESNVDLICVFNFFPTFNQRLGDVISTLKRRHCGTLWASNGDLFQHPLPTHTHTRAHARTHTHKPFVIHDLTRFKHFRPSPRGDAVDSTLKRCPKRSRRWLDVEKWLKMHTEPTLLSRRRNNVEVIESTLIQRGNNVDCSTLIQHIVSCLPYAIHADFSAWFYTCTYQIADSVNEESVMNTWTLPQFLVCIYTRLLSILLCLLPKSRQQLEYQ